MSLTYCECLHCLFSPVNKLMLSYLKKCFCVYLAASVVTRGADLRYGNWRVPPVCQG